MQPHTGVFLSNLVEICVKGLVVFLHKPLFTKDSINGAVMCPFFLSLKILKSS